GWGSGRGATLSARDLAERARRAFEEAGGVFVKLGQLLATRPDLLPPEALAELSRLQTSVAPVGRDEVAAQVEAQLGRPLDEVFAGFDWEPLGSASIAQAHAATLRDGSAVVVQVRRPGLADEFAEALLGELDFTVEARHVAEVAEAVADEPLLRVPRVYQELTRPGLLVVERLSGTPLAQASAGAEVPGSLALADALCRSQVRAMLSGDRFHGDPHPGNVLLLEDGRLGLIDLGISSRL